MVSVEIQMHSSSLAGEAVVFNDPSNIKNWTDAHKWVEETFKRGYFEFPINQEHSNTFPWHEIYRIVIKQS